MLHGIALSAQLHKKIAEGLLVHDASRLSDELESETQMLPPWIRSNHGWNRTSLNFIFMFGFCFVLQLCLALQQQCASPVSKQQCSRTCSVVSLQKIWIRLTKQMAESDLRKEKKLCCQPGMGNRLGRDSNWQHKEHKCRRFENGDCNMMTDTKQGCPWTCLQTLSVPCSWSQKAQSLTD